jgi:hypothetical protein
MTRQNFTLATKQSKNIPNKRKNNIVTGKWNDPEGNQDKDVLKQDKNKKNPASIEFVIMIAWHWLIDSPGGVRVCPSCTPCPGEHQTLPYSIRNK